MFDRAVYERNYIYNFHYHLIWVTKYRNQAFTTPELADEMKDIPLQLAEMKEICIEEMEVMPDHVHLLISFKPKHAPADIVKHLKGHSAKMFLAAHPEINAVGITDYKKAERFLYIDIVSYETNEEMLENIPFKQVLDMAIYCRLLMRQDANGIMSIVVNNMMLKTFSVSNEQLFSDALCNSTKIRPSELCSMYSALEEFMNEFPGGLMDNMPFYDDLLPMYVLSNKEHLNGAATLFYPGTMQLVASEFGGSYYILPSSIHEVMLIPGDGDMDVEFLLSMVTSINKDGLLPEDKLTDSVYYYDAEKMNFPVVINSATH